MSAETTTPEEVVPAGNGLGVTHQLANEIGSRLKQARTKSGKAMRSIASTIKVREQYLISIEEGRWDELPRGLNGRGIVRNYARELLVSIPELEPSEIKNHMNSQVHPFEVSSVQSTPRERAGETGQSNREIYSRGRAAQGLQRTIPRRPVEAAQAIEKPTSVNGNQKFSRSLFSDSDDDAPLGIVTPDVAKILGLPVDFPHGSQKLESVKAVDLVPVVNANEVISELLKSKAVEAVPEPEVHSHKENKKFSKKKRKYAEAQPNREAVVEKISVSNTRALSEQNNREQLSPEQKMIHPSTPDYTIPKLLVQDHQKEISKQQNQSQRLVLIAAVGVLVAATLTYFFVRQNKTVAEVEEKVPEAVQPLNAQDAAPPTTPIETTTNVQLAAPVDSGLTSTVTSPNNTTTEVTGDAPVTSQPQTAESVAASAVAPVTAAAPAVAPVTAAAPEPQVAPAAAPIASTVPVENTVSSGVERVATLNISADVDIKVVLDDKIFYTGRKASGALPIKFKDKAEIFVRDGSKVSLVYEGWDHGVLGHEGRRRRIVLNAGAVD